MRPLSLRASATANASSRLGCRSSTPAKGSAPSIGIDQACQDEINGSRTMTRFNLSEWAITHRALVLFMILVLGAAGVYSYANLGRAEDPSFTIKTMVVNVAWPGATATEMQTQVADKVEKKLQDLPYLDRVQSYSQPGVSFIQVFLTDRTPPAKVKDLWYQVRKQVG